MNNSREDAKNAKRRTFKEGVRRIANNHQNFAPSRLRVNQPAS